MHPPEFTKAKSIPQVRVFGHVQSGKPDNEQGNSGMPHETPFDGLKFLKSVWTEIATPNSRQHYHRHHCHATDPDDDGKDMQRTGDGKIIHTALYLQPQLWGDSTPSKAGLPTQVSNYPQVVYSVPEGRPACSDQELLRTQASPRVTRAAAHSIPGSGKTQVPTGIPLRRDPLPYRERQRRRRSVPVSALA